jgi:hypothetical protein
MDENGEHHRTIFDLLAPPASKDLPARGGGRTPPARAYGKKTLKPEIFYPLPTPNAPFRFRAYFFILARASGACPRALKIQSPQGTAVTSAERKRRCAEAGRCGLRTVENAEIASRRLCLRGGK